MSLCLSSDIRNPNIPLITVGASFDNSTRSLSQIFRMKSLHCPLFTPQNIFLISGHSYCGLSIIALSSYLNAKIVRKKANHQSTSRHVIQSSVTRIVRRAPISSSVYRLQQRLARRDYILWVPAVGKRGWLQLEVESRYFIERELDIWEATSGGYSKWTIRKGKIRNCQKKMERLTKKVDDQTGQGTKFGRRQGDFKGLASRSHQIGSRHLKYRHTDIESG